MFTDNIVLSQDRQNIILNDWGSAVECGSEVPYEGTYGFSEEPPVPGRLHTPSFKDDLVALVRSAYLMLFNERAPAKNENLKDFWESRLMTAQYWVNAVDASTMGNHTLLKSHLEDISRMK